MSSTSPIDNLYQQLIALFGTGGNELFSMEWPGRVLDEATYLYEVDSIYSELSKPQPVMEAEFRLVDQLMDLAPLVAGPNGKKLSVEFQDALSQLVPAYTDAGKLYGTDKEKIRDWLLEPITLSYVDDKGVTQQLKDVARIEAYDILNESYSRAVADWDEEKTRRLQQAQSVVGDARTVALEGYSKWLAEEAGPREAILEARFADLVVKAYYHETRAAVASLDIALPGEALEMAKGRMRSSGMSSLDESETIYPVVMSPADWATGLSTDFQPVDLLMDPAAMQQQLLTKQEQLRQISQEIAFLQNAQTGDPAKLQGAVNEAQAALDAATTNMVDVYGENAWTVARMYFGTVGVDAAEQKALDAALEAAGDGGLTSEQWDALLDGFKKVSAAQQQLTTASRNLTELQAALMAAKATDATQAVAALTSQASSIQGQIQQLQITLYSDSSQKRLKAMGTTDASGVPTWDPKKAPEAAQGTDGKLTNYPLLPTPMPAPGEFMDVILSFTADEMSQKSMAESSASQTSWDVDLFFGSASGSSSNSDSKAQSNLKSSSTSVQIGFRAMKVTADRGGWFDPSVFDLSAEMAHVTGSGEAYVPISKGQPTFTDGKQYAGVSDQSDAFKAINDGTTMPGYPTGFLVAKDVTIIVNVADSATAQYAHEQASSSAAGGGIFCFSVNSSSSSSSSESSTQSVQMGSNVVVKIPGPQILGWFQEYTPADKSKDYTQMPDGYLPEAPKELHAAQPQLAAPQPLAPLVRQSITAPAPSNGTNGDAAADPTLRQEVDELLANELDTDARHQQPA